MQEEMRHYAERSSFCRNFGTREAVNPCGSRNLRMALAVRPGFGMVRIDDDSVGPVTRLRLSGRIQSEDLASIRSTMSDARARKILDMTDVGLVDIAVVQFLNCCEDEGVELIECPPYVREWMARERAQGERP